MNALRFHPKAMADFTSSFLYYADEASDKIADQFEEEVNKVIILIERFPKRFRIIKGSYRIANTYRFPFQIVYSYNEKKKIVSVYAVHHASRHPKNRFRKF